MPKLTKNRRKTALVAAAIGLVLAFLLIPTGHRIKNWLQHRLESQSEFSASPIPNIAVQGGAGRDPRGMAQLCSQFYQTICKHPGTTIDPTGVVKPDSQGELEALRTYEEVIRAHPKWSTAETDEEFVKRLYTPKRRERIESAFKWVRHAVEKFITEQPAYVFSKVEKRLLRSRIHAVVLDLPPPATRYSDEPDLFTKNDVYFERTQDGQTRLRVGGAFLLSVKSWFNLIFTLAHELGHSIDPCEVQKIAAYERLKSCFVASGWVKPVVEGQSCLKFDYSSEVFADWLGVQVIGLALRTFATEFHGVQLEGAVINSVRDLCEQEDPTLVPDLTDHPAPVIRINEVFGANPVVREVLGCESQVTVSSSAPAKAYCNFDYQINPR